MTLTAKGSHPRTGASHPHALMAGHLDLVRVNEGLQIHCWVDAASRAHKAMAYMDRVLPHQQECCEYYT